MKQKDDGMGRVDEIHRVDLCFTFYQSFFFSFYLFSFNGCMNLL
jgi:hypothetical protein